MKKLTLAIVLLLSSSTGAVPAALSRAQAEEPAPKTATVTLRILGMATPSCPTLVKAAVGKLDGVQQVEASLKTKTARVKYAPDQISAKRIQKVIKDQVGFDSRVVTP